MTLTEREMEIAREVAQGKSDKQIGTVLGITCVTVRNHLANMRRKLGFSNRTQVALHYQRLQYLNQLAVGIGVTPAEARERETLRSSLKAHVVVRHAEPGFLRETHCVHCGATYNTVSEDAEFLGIEDPFCCEVSL